MARIDYLLECRVTPNGDRVKAWVRYPALRPVQGSYTHEDCLPSAEESTIHAHYLVRTRHNLEVYSEDGERLTRINAHTLRAVM